MADVDWELAKENIQPRKEGREVSSLMIGLTPRKDNMMKLHNEQQQFELALRANNGSNPMEIWYRYLVWTEHHAPAGSNTEVKNLLERCIHLYKDDANFKNDKNYLYIWLKYADILKDPTEIFNYMFAQDIGTQHCLFYESWAALLEHLGQYGKAEEVYNIGKARKAQPLERLQRNHSDFEKRLVKLVKENEDFNDEPAQEESRLSLAPLKKRSKGTVSHDRINGRSRAPNGGFKISKSVNQVNTGGFTVFCDENTDIPKSRLPSASGEWKQPPTNSLIIKENEQKPGPWNKCKIPKAPAAHQAAQKPGFDIYFDDEIVEKVSQTPKELVISERKPLSSKKVEKKSCENDALQTIIKEGNSNIEVMYCKDQVYMANQEFSLEELRSLVWLRKYGPIGKTQDDYTKHCITAMDLDETLMSQKIAAVNEDDVEIKENMPGISRKKDVQKFFKNGSKNAVGTLQVCEDSLIPALPNLSNLPNLSILPSPNENQKSLLHLHQQITSPCKAEDFLDNTKNNADESILNEFDDIGDFIPGQFQSTAIIDVTQMRPDIRLTKQNHQVLCDKELSQIQSFEDFEKDFKRIDISDGKDTDIKRILDDEKAILSCSFSQLSFNLKTKQKRQEVNPGSISQCLDFPMLLSEKPKASLLSVETKQEPKRLSDHRNAATDEEQNIDESLHHFVQMPNEVMKPKAIKVNNGGLSLDANREKENAPTNGITKFKIFDDSNEDQLAKPKEVNLVSAFSRVQQNTHEDKENVSAFKRLQGNQHRPSHQIDNLQLKKNSMPFTVFADCDDDDDAVDVLKDQCKSNVKSTNNDANQDEGMISGVFPLSSIQADKHESSDENKFDNVPRTPLLLNKNKNPRKALSDFPLISKSVPKSPVWAPSPTVNTKKAQQEILAMFNETLDCGKADFTLNQTEDDRSNVFEQQFSKQNGTRSAFEILSDSQVEVSSCTSSTQNASAYTTVQSSTVDAYHVKDLSPIEEWSDEDRTRQSSQSTSSSYSEKSLIISPLIIHNKDHGQQRMHPLPLINESSESFTNESFKKIESSTCNTKQLSLPSDNLSINSTKAPKPYEKTTKLMEKTVMAMDFRKYPNFYELSERCCERFAVNSRVNIGNDSFKILKKIAVGGFSTVYLSVCQYQNEDDCESQPETVLKVMKSQSICCWEFYVTEQMHERINSGQLCPSLHDSMILPRRAYTFLDGAVLEYPHYKGGTLLDLINRCTQNNVVITEEFALEYAAEICRIVDAVHDCDIIHGDIKPDNFLIKSDNMEDLKQFHRLTLADFGRSIDLKMLPPDVTFTGSCNTDQFECIEMRERLPWKYQVDYFGVAGTIHVVIFGAYITYVNIAGRYRCVRCPKRGWDKDFWKSVFDRLFNAPDCNRQTVLSDLCIEFEKRLTQARQAKK